MKNFMNFKTAFYTLVLTGLMVVSAHAQMYSNARIKVEVTVKKGKQTTVSWPSTFSLSYNKPEPIIAEQDAAAAATYSPFYVVFNYDVLDINLIKELTQNNESIDMDIVIKDSYGKLPTRKYSLKKVTLGGMNEQSSSDYSNSYVNLTCAEATVDGIVLPK